LNDLLIGKKMKSLSSHQESNRIIHAAYNVDVVIEKLSFILKRVATYIKPFNLNLEGSLEG
jgi:hypothetical protein